MTKKKIWMSWSSGKDSAYALFKLHSSKKTEITSLITTITTPYHRVSMHGVREELLDLQSQQLGIPIQKIYIPDPCTNSTYVKKMEAAILSAKKSDIKTIGFGDLFLEEIKNYRIKMLSETDITPIFPLWQSCTETLSKQIIASGIKSIITCIDLSKLPDSFLGREYNAKLLADLPPGIDPCGENGEFHTFVYDSPMFSNPIHVKIGDRVIKNKFGFIDLSSH